MYQRFQRGILHYDTGIGVAQGLLLGNYLKNVMTGQSLPPDLAAEARGSQFYRQYDHNLAGTLARPGDLPGSDLSGAFEPRVPQATVASAGSQVVHLAGPWRVGPGG